ncbi:hypothetical protein [Streptomyces pacificus]|uniref:Uncharacterized protein n=1 Tax=Streptomyces pacificus TaxID=2705029 RepID=A0A6A0AR14_9ACTN|nr:hypothetical protein [Streptomyces pacificus]GFH34334.1 hypothetical protein SCWH03_05480 [Streptomyces pacificus]
MGYELRRWFEDRLPQEISSGERVVALAIADLVWDDSRIGYGRLFTQKLLHKTGFENETQIGKVLGKLAARGIELRVPIAGQDGKPLRNKRGQLVYAHRGHQRTFRVPFESEFPGRPAPYWNDEGERSPDRETNGWRNAERSPARETFNGERSPSREGNKAERSPARESMVTQAGDPIPLTTTTYLPPSVAPRAAATPGRTDGSKTDDDAITAAVDFLMNLPQPWAVGRVSAKATAPQLLEVAAEQGWNLDDQLVTKLTENPGGIRNYRQVLRIRIGDLPKAPPAPAPRATSPLPPWCGECADGARAAEREARLRLVYDDRGHGHPCPKCHPQMTSHAA